MAYDNNFYLIGQGTPNLRMFDSSQKKELADIFCESSEDIIYTRHLYFTNFTELGCNVSYFNVVRDPVRRFVSRYNWYREVYHMKSAPYFRHQYVLQTQGKLFLKISHMSLCCSEGRTCPGT